jgi:hypothetical protein
MDQLMRALKLADDDERVGNPNPSGTCSGASISRFRFSISNDMLGPIDPNMACVAQPSNELATRGSAHRSLMVQWLGKT